MDKTCFFCGAPWHPATGAWYSPRIIACGRCVREFYGWLKGHVKRWQGKGRPDFYGGARADDKGPWKKDQP